MKNILEMKCLSYSIHPRHGNKWNSWFIYQHMRFRSLDSITKGCESLHRRLFSFQALSIVWFDGCPKWYGIKSWKSFSRSPSTPPSVQAVAAYNRPKKKMCFLSRNTTIHIRHSMCWELHNELANNTSATCALQSSLEREAETQQACNVPHPLLHATPQEFVSRKQTFG